MERPAKAHRAPQSGRGAEKKAVAKDKDGVKVEKKKGFNEKVSYRLDVNRLLLASDLGQRASDLAACLPGPKAGGLASP